MRSIVGLGEIKPLHLGLEKDKSLLQKKSHDLFVIYSLKSWFVVVEIVDVTKYVQKKTLICYGFLAYYWIVWGLHPFT